MMETTSPLNKTSTSHVIARPNETVLAVAFLVVTTILCFIPLSNQTGYYLNDWHPLAGKLNDTGLFQMWAHERYGVGFLYSITYPILGDHFFLWQLFSISLRLLSALGFLWLLRLVWKDQPYFTTASALVFLIYPGFMQQPIALTFSNHFIGYCLAIFSLVFTVLALQTDRRKLRIGLIATAALFELAYLFDYEYMLGFEVVRIALIWYLLYRPLRWRELWPTAKRLVRTCLPYLAVVGGFLFWRVVIFKSTRPTTNMGALGRKYLEAPVEMIGRIFLETIRDVIETVWLGWGVPFFQVGADIDYGHFAVSVLLGLAAVGLLLWLIRFTRYEAPPATAGDRAAAEVRTPYADAIWLGLLAILVALMPVILSDREVKFKNQMDRYTLHATLGIALFTVGLVFHAVRAGGRKWVLAFLVFMAVLIHYNNSAVYVRWWEYQKNLWWQLSWRAPNIKDGTVIMPLLPFGNRLQEDIEVWTPAQVIYRAEQSPPLITAEVLNPDTALDVFFQDKTSRNFRGGIQYTRDFHFPLIVSYPSGGSCVHVIDGSRLELSMNDEPMIYRVAQFSQIVQVVPDGQQHVPPPAIFGAEPTHGWCYLYQKASLARQRGDWAAVAALGEQALADGLSPSDPSEWLPFLDGYLQTGQLERAGQIAEMVSNSQSTAENLCAQWQYVQEHPNHELTALLCGR